MRFARPLFLVLLIAVTGCERFGESQPEPKKAPRDSRHPAHSSSSSSEKPQNTQQYLPRGRIELALPEPIETEECVVRLIKLGADRPTILQIASYADAQNETFPSVFLRAEVSSEQPESLSREPIDATLYVQRKPDGPVWHSLPHEPVTLIVIEVTEERIECEITNGLLVSSQDAETINVSGHLSGVLQ